ncbi:MAG: FAD-dependent oxidoreductase [Candidatus Hodarchaeota archaeon]
MASENKPDTRGLAGSVMVVGGGIAGIQASLDLTSLGFEVILVEKKATIGGIMAQLDKTFPTNDCSLCILAPKMVEVFRNPNIKLFTNTTLKQIKIQDDGNIKVNVEKKHNGIDESLCTNCGECYNICPVRFNEDFSWFDAGLKTRRATNIPFPSAVPPVYKIEEDKCLHEKYGICGKCQPACPANAINYDFSVESKEFIVGGVILATGCSQVAPERFKNLLGNHPDVLSGIQFERLMCASGPTGGDIHKITNRKHAQKIAFVQCVGSRSKKEENVEFCSSVCCMYATKEAQITKEHDEHVECVIFNNEIRACGKGFREYCNRARDVNNVKFIPGRVAGIIPDPITQDLIVQYENVDGGTVEQMKFDLVVLESALLPNTEDISRLLSVERNAYGFFDWPVSMKLESQGILLSGYNTRPMDIPSSVVSGSMAAAKLSSRLNSARFTRIEEKTYPVEKEVLPNEKPRIGVFVCNCGTNIGGYLNTKEIVDYIKELPHVTYTQNNMYSCSEAALTDMTQAIIDNDLNRVVMASCTPRTHETLFRNACKEAGLNPYYFEFVNIREQVSWVHMKETEKAQVKAKDLLRMGIARAAHLEPLQKQKVSINPTCVVCGGGISGITAALNVADQGFKVTLIEKEDTLGGRINDLYKLYPIDMLASELITENINALKKNSNIEVLTGSTIKNVSGYIGNFEVEVESKGGVSIITTGAIIVATGSSVLEPSGLFGYDGESVITQLELESRLKTRDVLKSNKVVMINCAGARNEQRKYCSSICCNVSIKNARMIKEKNPQAEVIVLYRDIQAQGVESERLYNDAREKGVIFVKYSPDSPPIVDASNKIVKLRRIDSDDDLAISYDLVVLSTPLVSNPDSEALAQMLKVPREENGFFLEAHVKLRPVDFATDGIFTCGTARWPSNIRECVEQANGAASRVGGILSKDTFEVEGNVSQVDQDLCVGCKICIKLCPYNAITRNEDAKAEIIPVMCKGCGICAASCPEGAITSRHFTNDQILAQVKHVLRRSVP